MGRLSDCFSEFMFEYDTPRMVLVRHKKVGIVYRLIQLGVLAYIIGWVFMYVKGYQSEDSVVSTVSVKMQGIAYTNEKNNSRIWDVADYVFPHQGVGSFVVMTNYIETAGQKQGNCTKDGVCKSDSDCEKGKSMEGEKGILTGKCVEYKDTLKTCEIFGWCPLEDDYHIPDPPLLMAAENFTMFIKNAITFPRYGVSRSNVVQFNKSCIYHKDTDPLCPIFRLGDLVTMAGFDFRKIAVKGGMIVIGIIWDCDLDWSASHCNPTFNIHGLYGEDSLSTPGYNFRFAKYFVQDRTEKRTLMKVFGIRFDIIVHGMAGKFDIIPTMTTIGSGVGIFGVGVGSFVVMTNYIETAGQKQGNCTKDGVCKSDSDCEKGKSMEGEKGILTGKCVEYKDTLKTCEIFGWCPLEDDYHIPDPPLLMAAENFTMFIKNAIMFPRYGVSRSNVVQFNKSCIYHKDTDPLCPIFRLGDLVTMAGFDFRKIAVKGGMIVIGIIWDCDLDWSASHCNPTFNIHGLYGEDSLSTPGYNFRFAKYFVEDRTEKRTLMKVFGIRFDIIVHGMAGKFDIIPTMTTVGSGVGIFGVATVLCDLLLLHFMQRRNVYKSLKFKSTEDEGEE